MSYQLLSNCDISGTIHTRHFYHDILRNLPVGQLSSKPEISNTELYVNPEPVIWDT